jgi:hypothetical protein
MRDMLAFVRGVKNLRQLDGGIHVIKEMCAAIKDGVYLIEEYVDSRFTGSYVFVLIIKHR